MPRPVRKRRQAVAADREGGLSGHREAALLLTGSGMVGALFVRGADAFDADLLFDLAASAVPVVSELSPRDVASFAAALAHLRFRNRELVGALCRHSVRILESFSGPQLARTIYGLGSTGAADCGFLHKACDALGRRAVSLHPDHMAQALVGLSEAEYLEHPVVPQLLKALERRVDRLFAEDCIHLLRVSSKVDSRLLPKELLPLLQRQLRAKLRVFWCLEQDTLADLLEALLVLRLPDQPFLQMLMRRLAFILQRSSSREFLRLLGCLAALTDCERLLVRTHIHRRPKLQAALGAQLSALAALRLDGDSTAALLFSASHLGFLDESLTQWVEALLAVISARVCASRE